jgi:hypothetical protein
MNEKLLDQLTFDARCWDLAKVYLNEMDQGHVIKMVEGIAMRERELFDKMMEDE